MKLVDLQFGGKRAAQPASAARGSSLHQRRIIRGVAANVLFLFSSTIFSQVIPGEVDPTFVTPEFQREPTCLLIQNDDKIIVGTEWGILRLFPDGVRDTSFVHYGDYLDVRDIEDTDDGQLLLAMRGQSLPEAPRGTLVILDPMGRYLSSLERETINDPRVIRKDSEEFLYVGSLGRITKFSQDFEVLQVFDLNPTGYNFPAIPEDVAFHSDGRMIVSGIGLRAAGVRRDIVRFFPDGSVDVSLDVGNHGENELTFKRVAVQPDDRILIAGDIHFNQHRVLGAIRITEYGRADPSFMPHPNAGIHGRALEVFFDMIGRPIIVGDLKLQDDPRNRYCIARLKPSGELDTSLLVEADYEVGLYTWRTDIQQLSNSDLVFIANIADGNRKRGVFKIKGDGPVDRQSPRVELRLTPQITVHGRPGSTYAVEYKDSASGVWKPLQRITLSGDSADVYDRSPRARTRLYRAVTVE
ncbi:hypothetical protein N8612_06790 [Verrucomicrobia bacterium]|jgi:hypothetical protein|nr:hypothetical protein [Verrucomicrobiota bacterium]